MTDERTLDRIVSLPDPRNWQAADFLYTTDLDRALAAVLAQHHTDAFKTWAKLISAAAEGTQPAVTQVIWPCTEQLDQGQTGHCVGFGSAQWCDTLGTDQLDDHYLDVDGHKIYYECKIIDNEPKAENGSSVHSAAKVLKARGRIKNYAWTASLDEIKQWLLTKGPVLVGTDWYAGMFTPDAQGVIHPTGNVEGGHCYVLAGYDPTTDLIELHNSWGSSWGVDGRARIPAAEFEMLAASNGEALVAVELA
jgi:hypothetical protein